eukprot:PhM_4_TR13243/c0_g2_i1/m.43993
MSECITTTSSIVLGPIISFDDSGAVTTNTNNNDSTVSLQSHNPLYLGASLNRTFHNFDLSLVPEDDALWHHFVTLLLSHETERLSAGSAFLGRGRALVGLGHYIETALGIHNGRLNEVTMSPELAARVAVLLFPADTKKRRAIRAQDILPDDDDDDNEHRRQSIVFSVLRAHCLDHMASLGPVAAACLLRSTLFVGNGTELEAYRRGIAERLVDGLEMKPLSSGNETFFLEHVDEIEMLTDAAWNVILPLGDRDLLMRVCAAFTRGVIPKIDSRFRDVHVAYLVRFLSHVAVVVGVVVEKESTSSTFSVDLLRQCLHNNNNNNPYKNMMGLILEMRVFSASPTLASWRSLEEGYLRPHIVGLTLLFSSKNTPPDNFKKQSYEYFRGVLDVANSSLFQLVNNIHSNKLESNDVWLLLLQEILLVFIDALYAFEAYLKSATKQNSKTRSRLLDSTHLRLLRFVPVLLILPRFHEQKVDCTVIYTLSDIALSCVSRLLLKTKPAVVVTNNNNSNNNIKALSVSYMEAILPYYSSWLNRSNKQERPNELFEMVVKHCFVPNVLAMNNDDGSLHQSVLSQISEKAARASPRWVRRQALYGSFILIIAQQQQHGRSKNHLLRGLISDIILNNKGNVQFLLRTVDTVAASSPSNGLLSLIPDATFAAILTSYISAPSDVFVFEKFLELALMKQKATTTTTSSKRVLPDTLFELICSKNNNKNTNTKNDSTSTFLSLWDIPIRRVITCLLFICTGWMEMDSTAAGGERDIESIRRRLRDGGLLTVDMINELFALAEQHLTHEYKDGVICSVAIGCLGLVLDLELMTEEALTNCIDALPLDRRQTEDMLLLRIVNNALVRISPSSALHHRLLKRIVDVSLLFNSGGCPHHVPPECLTQGVVALLAHGGENTITITTAATSLINLHLAMMKMMTASSFYTFDWFCERQRLVPDIITPILTMLMNTAAKESCDVFLEQVKAFLSSSSNQNEKMSITAAVDVLIKTQQQHHQQHQQQHSYSSLLSLTTSIDTSAFGTVCKYLSNGVHYRHQRSLPFSTTSTNIRDIAQRQIGKSSSSRWAYLWVAAVKIITSSTKPT